jgi:hypothetical protein
VRQLRIFRIVYALLAIQFAIPALSYMVVPEMTEEMLDRINRALGGAAVPPSEVQCESIWHMLAVGNVMTLGFMCALMAWNLRRHYALLPGLAFLKGFSAFYSLLLGFAHRMPMFYAIAVLDAATTGVIIYFARSAYQALRDHKDEIPPSSFPHSVPSVTVR